MTQVMVPTAKPPRYVDRDRAADRRPPAAVGRRRDARGDRHDRGAPHRRDSRDPGAARARDPRARDGPARDRGGAAGAARADQSALSLQRADDDRLPDSDGSAARAADAAAADVAAARRAPIGRRVHDARPRARGDRGVPRHRAGALRASAARDHRRAGAAAPRPAPGAGAAAARRKRRQARRRPAGLGGEVAIRCARRSLAAATRAS